MKKIIVFILFALNIGTLLSQEYFNKIVPFEYDNTYDNPFVAGLYIGEDKYLIPVINPGNDCTLVRYDSNNIEYFDYESFVFSQEPLVEINNNIYVYGKDRSKKIDLRLLKLKDDNTIDWVKKYKTKGKFNFPTFSMGFDNSIYISYINDFKENNHREIGVKRIDTLGNEIWSRNYSKDLYRTYLFDLVPTSDSGILISCGIQKRKEWFSYGQLIKIDTLGNVIWRSDGDEYFSFPNTPAWVAELSDGSIVQTYELDRYDRPDLDYPNHYTDYPVRMKWYDKDGNPMREKLLLYPRLDEMYFNQVEAGKGDYFFGYGTYIADEPDDYITEYSFGLITKFANNGDTIWTHRYQYNAYDSSNVYFQVKYMEELDNGDLVAVGDIWASGQKVEIWLFKVNSEGCFGEENCDEVQRTDVQDFMRGEFFISVYPNPARDKITIALPKDRTWKEWKIYALSGKQMMRGNITSQKNYEISGLSLLDKGFYILKVFDKEGKEGIGKFVVE